MRSTCDRLKDIVEAIDKAARFASAERNERSAAAVLYELIVIGEAVGALPAGVLDDQEAVPKDAIVGMRNLVVHTYHRIDMEYAWGTVDDDLPVLRDAVVAEAERLGCP